MKRFLTIIDLPPGAYVIRTKQPRLVQAWRLLLAILATWYLTGQLTGLAIRVAWPCGQLIVADLASLDWLWRTVDNVLFAPALKGVAVC